jgi:hypothetical protein
MPFVQFLGLEVTAELGLDFFTAQPLFDVRLLSGGRNEGRARLSVARGFVFKIDLRDARSQIGELLL